MTAVNGLALAALALGEREEARAALTRSFALAQETGDRRGLAVNLVGQAGLATQQGNDARAVRLASAAQTRLVAVGLDLDPEEAHVYHAALDQARQTLSPAVFASAWAGGERLTDDDVRPGAS